MTGSTDGIGKEFALQLAAKGFNIVLVARAAEKLHQTKQQIVEQFSDCKVDSIQFDFGETTGIERVAAELKGKDVGVLVNNVGTSHEHPEYFFELSPPTIDSIVNVNILNTLRLTREVLPSMIESGKGLVLNVGSFSGETPVPLLQTYSASKAFLKTWSLALAAEIRPKGIDVQLLNTYFVVSNMSKRKRPSPMVPLPKDYVAHALRTAGQSDFATPYPVHALLNIVMDFVPDQLMVPISLAEMRKVRQIVMQKSRRE